MLSFRFGGIGKDIASGAPGDIDPRVMSPSLDSDRVYVEFRTDGLKLGIPLVRQCQQVFESPVLS